MAKCVFKSFCVAPTMGYQYWVFTFKMNIDLVQSGVKFNFYIIRCTLGDYHLAIPTHICFGGKTL